ncbi:two-component system sensor histidine kinase NtrB [Magnetofaba australis]|uniref:histidine kinase n=1 Tax=Magnetofaba australis IT-1 TaxID=1434232 RepID=A0A1Y2K791_9PROT|nr:ATP-binding protein [Magnetofaba australis]OSM06199.1 putative signal transduction histidine kinase, nitrogen specific, NtrB [Magnetofaba australis IT-1]
MYDDAQFHPVALFDQVSCGVMALDRDGVVRETNAAAERLFGRTRHHMVGKKLEDLLPGHPVALDLIRRAESLNTVCRFRGAELSPGPDIHLHVSLTANPIHDAHGVIIGLLLQMEETSAADKLEEGRRLNETLDSMGALALAVAHEVKNPLAGIRGAAQLLEMETTSESGAACTTLIRAEVDRVSRLLDTLLGLADDAPSISQAINIHEVLQHVIMASGCKEERLERDFDPSLPEVAGDRDKLIQLFLNLLKNADEAARAAPNNAGRVRISTRISNQVRLSQGRRKMHVMVEILDNGAGVPPELRNRIFMPFVTSKSRGPGLGLAICQKIVHEHEGQIELESQPGRTAFRVYLPAND